MPYSVDRSHSRFPCCVMHLPSLLLMIHHLPYFFIFHLYHFSTSIFLLSFFIPLYHLSSFIVHLPSLIFQFSSFYHHRLGFAVRMRNPSLNRHLPTIAGGENGRPIREAQIGALRRKRRGEITDLPRGHSQRSRI